MERERWRDKTYLNVEVERGNTDIVIDRESEIEI